MVKLMLIKTANIIFKRLVILNCCNVGFHHLKEADMKKFCTQVILLTRYLLFSGYKSHLHTSLN